MAFFRKIQQSINKLWYARSVIVGKPVSTNQVAERLSQISTVSRSDTFAVLKSLGIVMSDYMADGRSVKLDGVGTFYYTAITKGKGVENPDLIKASSIAGVRVRFIPETTRTSSNQVATRSMVSSNIFWQELGDLKSMEPEDPTPEDPSE